jgi:hypothetical protein
VRLFITATKILLLAALPFLAYGYGTKVTDLIRTISFSDQCAWFGLGCVAFIPTGWFCKRYFRNPWEFISTLEHELTHAIVGLPFLIIPRGIRVTATQGGHIKQIWLGPVWLMPIYGLGNLLSTLAPYFLPTISYLLIASSFFITQSKTPWFFIVLGFITAFHIVTTWAETRYRQPDIQQAGIIFSSIFLPVANLIALGGLLAFITTDSRGFWQFWTDGLWRSVSLLTSTVGLARN